MSDMEDKRRFMRLDCMFKVEFMNMEKGEQLSSVARNISAGGICVYTNEPLPNSVILFLKFHFPERERTFGLKGRVVWTKPAQEKDEKGFENGIQFLEVNEEIKESIESKNIVNLRMSL
jgi:uncharacterized protein (TIGR02266 family)